MTDTTILHEWEQFLDQQEIELGKETVDKWLRTLRIQRAEGGYLRLQAQDSFQAVWFEEHIRNKLQEKLKEGKTHKGVKVQLALAHLSKKKQPKVKETTEQVLESHLFERDPLNPLFRFDHFLVSRENQLVHQLMNGLLTSVESPTSPCDSFNPIYLYGPIGSGKTHLLMGITEALRHRGINALYARAESFTDHVVMAIRAGEMRRFRLFYRSAQFLFIDDAHLFASKSATQEEFFHTFNTLHLDGKQIVLASRCAPRELQGIEPRLVSRFEWGIVLSLKSLPLSEWPHLLMQRANALGLSLTPEVKEFLLKTFTSHPQALTQAIEAIALRLRLQTEAQDATLTAPQAKRLVADLLNEEERVTLSPAKIIQAVSEHYGVRCEDVIGRSQTKECTLPRQVAMHLCREKLHLSFAKIGALFCRDHSTVMASVKFVQTALQHEQSDIWNARQAIFRKLQC